jgi:hypothetical protein
MIPDVGGVLFSMRVDGSSVAVVQPKNESYLEDSSSAGGSRAPCTHRPLLAL